MIGMSPRDEFEGMAVAQLVACHNASMECYRRAMIGEQTFEGRRENLAQAAKLSRTYATLLEALNRHRSKGQQKVTVEHVHVHSGGQAVVGVVEPPGGGNRAKSEDQPHAIAHAPSTPMLRADAERQTLSVTGDAERSMPDARRTVSGRTEGEQKCLEARALLGRGGRPPTADRGPDPHNPATVLLTKGFRRDRSVPLHLTAIGISWAA